MVVPVDLTVGVRREVLGVCFSKDLSMVSNGPVTKSSSSSPPTAQTGAPARRTRLVI